MKGTAARMGVMKRVSLVFKAKANKALDKMEDPRETLDYSYQRQLEMLTKVRRGVADVATSRKRVELQMNQLQQSSTKLEDQARKALGMGREDLAREALSRKSSSQSQLNDLQVQYAQLQAEEEKLTVASQRLQAKVDAFRTRKETIKATYTAAEAQTRINEAFSGISEEMGDVGQAIQRAEDKTAQMQARAGAIDELQTQYAQLQGEEEKLTVASQRLQAKVDSFRTRKETIKATYTAAEAQTRINEAFTGISEEMGDVGMAIQRAEDKTAQMQARAGAIDELMASGALDDAVGGKRDDIQSELEAMSASSDVERELAMLRGELTTGAPKQLEGSAANGDAQDQQEKTPLAKQTATRHTDRPQSQCATANRIVRHYRGPRLRGQRVCRGAAGW